MTDTTPPQAPKRSWFARHKILTAALAVFALFVVAGVAGSGKKANTSASDPLTSATPAATSAPVSPAAAPSSAAASPAAAAAPAVSSKPNDKGWVVQSLMTADDGVGDFGGTARITNTNDSAKTAVFTFTLARAGQQIASLQGSAQQVSAGKTVTVQLISQEKYSAGKYTWDFQTDTSY